MLRNKNLSKAPLAEPELEYADSPDPQSQPEPDHTVETEALTEQNHTLKRKLRRAITVANGCAWTLGRERAQVVEERRKLEWALLIERAAHQKTRINPNGLKLRPTPAEVEARMAEEKRQREKEEHRRQALYEHDQRRKLAEKIERELHDKAAKAERARWSRPIFTPEQSRGLHDAARAFAASKGREKVSMADYRECNRLGLLRLAVKPRTRPATSTSLEHCTPSSSGQECP